MQLDWRILAKLIGDLGFFAAKDFKQRNTEDCKHRIIITGRNQERGEEARKRIAAEGGLDANDVLFVAAEFTSFQKVDALADEVLRLQKAPYPVGFGFFRVIP